MVPPAGGNRAGRILADRARLAQPPASVVPAGPGIRFRAGDMSVPSALKRTLHARCTVARRRTSGIIPGCRARLVADHGVDPPRGLVDAARLRVAEPAQPRCALPPAVRVPAAGDAGDDARHDEARGAAAGGGRPRRGPADPAVGRQAGGGGHRRDRARADRRVPRAGREHAELPRGARARALAAAARRTRSSRSPTPTSRATRSGSPRSAPATTSRRPGARTPPPRLVSCEAALARFESEALSAELDEPPAGRRARACARSTTPATDATVACSAAPCAASCPAFCE